MNNQDLDQFLASAVHNVLETMFFSEVLGSAEPATDVAELKTRLTFSGEMSGAFALRISESSARSLAASFLGEDDESITECQKVEAVCELTNILCGSILSKLGCRKCFDLSSPRLLSEAAEPLITDSDCQQSFTVENGVLTVSLSMSVPE